MKAFPCRDYAEEPILTLLLTTAPGTTQICHPGLCTVQHASTGGGIGRYVEQAFSTDSLQGKRNCRGKPESLQNAHANPSTAELTHLRTPRGRQCVACDARRGVGGRSASHSGSRSNSNSRRPSFSSQKARCNADSASLKPVCRGRPIPSSEPVNSTQSCPCFSSGQQREHRADLQKHHHAGVSCQQSPPLCQRGPYCEISRMVKTNLPRHCSCSVWPPAQEKTDDLVADVGTRVTAGARENLPCETQSRGAPLPNEQLCCANSGGGGKDETSTQDGKTTLQWALGNMRAEATRTRRVLEGCRSQLLARADKRKPCLHSPRAPGKQASLPHNPSATLHKRDGSQNVSPARRATTALRDPTAAAAPIQTDGSQQPQQQQFQKQQELLASLFQKKFEKEMQTFRRRLTNVTGTLNDKLRQLLDRETELKKTVNELLKERENSSRLRRIYFEAVKKNKQLHTRNSSLERALLDVELKLCRPHNVWRVLGCPAAAALQYDLHRLNSLCDEAIAASQGHSACSAAATRTGLHSAYPLCRRGGTGGDVSSKDIKCFDRHATQFLVTSCRPLGVTDSVCLPRRNSSASGARLSRSLPCFLHSREASSGNSPRDHANDEADSSIERRGPARQQRTSGKDQVQQVACGTGSSEGNSMCTKMQSAAQPPSSSGTRDNVPRRLSVDDEARADSLRATAETQSTRGHCRQENMHAKDEGRNSVLVTHRLGETPQKESRSGVGTCSSKERRPEPVCSSARAHHEKGSRSALPQLAPSPKTSVSAASSRVFETRSPCPKSSTRTVHDLPGGLVAGDGRLEAVQTRNLPPVSERQHREAGHPRDLRANSEAAGLEAAQMSDVPAVSVTPRLEEGRTPELLAGAGTTPNKTAPCVSVPPVARHSHGRSAPPDLVCRSGKPATAPETCHRAVDAAEHTINHLTASDSSCTFMAPLRCSEAAAAKPKQLVPPMVERETLKPAQDSHSVPTVQGHTDTSALRRFTTEDNMHLLSRERPHSMSSPNACPDVALTRDVACAERSYSSSSSSNSSSLPESMRDDIAVQRRGPASISVSAGSASPRHSLSSSSHDICASNNSSTLDSEPPGTSSDSSSSSCSCSCCCVPCPVPFALQGGPEGRAVGRSTQDSPFSQFHVRRRVPSPLTETENMESCVFKTEDLQPRCTHITLERHQPCTNAIRGGLPRKRDEQLVAATNHQSSLADRCVESSCSSVRAYSNIDSAWYPSSSSSSSSSSVLPFAPLPCSSSSSGSKALGSSSTSALPFSSGTSPSFESSFTQSAEAHSEKAKVFCSLAGETCRTTYRDTPCGCVSWHLPHSFTDRDFTDAYL